MITPCVILSGEHGAQRQARSEESPQKNLRALCVFAVKENP